MWRALIEMLAFVSLAACARRARVNLAAMATRKAMLRTISPRLPNPPYRPRRRQRRA
jgi:hypothetical protein